uniref:Family with sequence similarity 174 member B n=1 Tax=Anolis carolinensis TaxID=28377 RepID=H9G383_ANOCA
KRRQEQPPPSLPVRSLSFLLGARMLSSVLLLFSFLLLLPASSSSAAVPPVPSNATADARPAFSEPPPAGNRSDSGAGARLSPVSALLRDLPALKAAVVGACAASAALVACLLFRVLRSGRKMKKTRKYDIITTPAERVEMAPLNEDDDEDEDSTVFDIKYR